MIGRDNVYVRTFIYGSCVTRDGVDIAWESNGLSLVGYVARQSLISSVAPVTKSTFNLEAVASPFQKRMIDGDLSGNLVGQLRHRHAEIDLLLWDCTDERLGVQAVPTGGFVTRVVDYSKGIWQGNQPLGNPVLLGTPHHWDLWRKAADHVASVLVELNLLSKTIVNATPWAVETDTGEAVTYAPISPEEFNETMLRYYGHLEGLGLRIVSPDLSTVVARGDHKWGVAPFHYVDGTYRSFLDHALGRS